MHSSYSFMRIPLKLYRCLGHGLKMCMLCGHNLRIMICYFFHKMNLVIVATKVKDTSILCIKLFHDSSYIKRQT